MLNFLHDAAVYSQALIQTLRDLNFKLKLTRSSAAASSCQCSPGTSSVTCLSWLQTHCRANKSLIGTCRQISTNTPAGRLCNCADPKHPARMNALSSCTVDVDIGTELRLTNRSADHSKLGCVFTTSQAPAQCAVNRAVVHAMYLRRVD